MESCTICFLEFTEKPTSCLNNRCRYEKFISCGHSLCYSCYLKLKKSNCPYCRNEFTYSLEDLAIMNKKNNKIPHSISVQSNQLNTLWQSPTDIEYNILLNDTINEPFSRLKKNSFRRRRRNLTLDEIITRRQEIKHRCTEKWSHKEGRIIKELHLY